MFTLVVGADPTDTRGTPSLQRKSRGASASWAARWRSMPTQNSLYSDAKRPTTSATAPSALLQGRMSRIAHGESARRLGTGVAVQQARQGRGQRFSPHRRGHCARSQADGGAGVELMLQHQRQLQNGLPGQKRQDRAPLRAIQDRQVALRRRAAQVEPVGLKLERRRCMPPRELPRHAVDVDDRRAAALPSPAQAVAARPESSSGRRRSSCRLRPAKLAILRPPASRDRDSGQGRGWDSSRIPPGWSE